MTYFDIHDILCEEQLVRVRFLQDIPWTSLLMTMSDETDQSAFITAGTVLKLPLWMARILSEIGVLVVLPVKQFGTKIRADLAADATAVNLKDLSPYWYLLGMKISLILPGEGIARMMKGAFASRLGFIGRGIFSPNESCNDPHKTVFGIQGSSSILDHTEQRIYAATVAARKNGNDWHSRVNNLLKPFDIYNSI